MGNLAKLHTLGLSVIPAELATSAICEPEPVAAIPPELGNLSNLEGLVLDGNELSGAIPPELGNLSNLTELRLSENQLSGAIPSELGNLSNLERLTLGGSNQFTGCIPASLRDVSENDLAEAGLPFCGAS